MENEGYSISARAMGNMRLLEEYLTEHMPIVRFSIIYDALGRYPNFPHIGIRGKEIMMQMDIEDFSEMVQLMRKLIYDGVVTENREQKDARRYPASIDGTQSIRSLDRKCCYQVSQPQCGPEDHRDKKQGNQAADPDTAGNRHEGNQGVN